MLNATQYQRYQRQVILKQFGEEAQQKLLQSSVLIIGAGGLGCPAMQYLVAAGIGNIGIADDDFVALNNLHRQVLYTTGDIGFLKAEIAKKHLQQINPDAKITVHALRVTNQNALELIAGYDYVLDGTDNFTTRYLINDACVLLKKPLIYGAVAQFEGQVAVFNYATAEQPLAVNYRHLFAEAPEAGSIMNCAEAGVIGVLPGIIGTMQANEVIKLITGIGNPLINQLLTYNALTNQSYIFDLLYKQEINVQMPQDANAFKNYNYNWFCAEQISVAQEIDADDFASLLQKNTAIVIDVREKGEQPEVGEFQHIHIPLQELKHAIPSFENETIILFCQSGKRSAEAAKILSATFGESKKIYTLKGGILNWKSAGMKTKKVKNIFVEGAINSSFIADSIQKHSTKTNIGAHSIFLGQVRSDVIESKVVTAIEYTAYEEMALEKMHEIREAVFEKYELTCMHIYHSLGLVKSGEISLLVFTSSAHRKAAIDACEEVVERIKKELPVWGKEVFEDNSYQWKQNTSNH